MKLLTIFVTVIDVVACCHGVHYCLFFLINNSRKILLLSSSINLENVQYLPYILVKFLTCVVSMALSPIVHLLGGGGLNNSDLELTSSCRLPTGGGECIGQLVASQLIRVMLRVSAFSGVGLFASN